jgi:hypothetical protein
MLAHSFRRDVDSQKSAGAGDEEFHVCIYQLRITHSYLSNS